MKKILSIAFILIGLVAHAQTPVLGPGGNIVSVPVARDITDTLIAKVWNRKGIVLSATVAGEEGNTYESTVLRDVNTQLLGNPSTDTIFKMWYTGGWNSNNIYYAESPNGYPGTWVKRSTAVLTGRLRSCVLKIGSTFYMYSVTGNPSTVLDQLTSTDGVTWTVAHASVLTAATLGVSRIDNSSVFLDGSTWRMMIDVASGGAYSIAYLTSTDGFTWTQPFTNPVITGLGGSGAWFTKIGSNYYVWCHGPGGSGGVLPTDGLMYKSTNLQTWTLSPAGFTIRRRGADEGEGTTVGQVADLTLLAVKNSVYTYYSASSNGASPTGALSIKLAVAPMRFDSLVTTNQNDVSYKNHDMAVGNEVIRGLPGGVLFVGKSNKLQASYSKLFYDEGTGFLGVGIGAPLVYPFQVKYNTIGSARMGFFNDTTGFNQTDFAIGKSALTNTMFFGANYGNAQNSYIQDKSGAFNMLFVSGSTTVAALKSNGFEIYGGTPINFARATNTTLSRQTFSTAGATDFYFGQRGQTGALSDLSLTLPTKGVYQIGQATGNMYIGETQDKPINAVAKLQIESTTMGVLFPSMNRTQFNAITTTKGLIAFDNVLNKFIYNDGTTTKVILDSASASSGGTGTSYTPTVTTGTNNTVATAVEAIYTVTGGVTYVNVSGQVNVTSTGATIWTITLPNTNNGTAGAYEGSFMMAENSGTSYAIGSVVRTNSTTVTLRFNSTIGATGLYSAQFSYRN